MSKKLKPGDDCGFSGTLTVEDGQVLVNGTSLGRYLYESLINEGIDTEGISVPVRVQITVEGEKSTEPSWFQKTYGWFYEQDADD